MTPSTEIGLFAPPIMAAIVFVLTWNIERTANSTGKVSPGRLRLYLLGCGVLMLIGYVMLWQHELKTTWFAYPFWMSVGFIGVVGCIVYLVASQRGATAKELEIDTDPPNQSMKPTRTIASRVFAWIVIIWGVLGLLGGIAAIALRVAH